ncbi:MAG: hypothetical protein FWE71_08650 [Nocardioidaceae bacterium]|nr:hypothetical protein [Nocardioidaceae bacterium]MCL2612942.1 hypothetical protein [Nocardioidaceae bacterium]
MKQTTSTSPDGSRHLGSVPTASGEHDPATLRRVALRHRHAQGLVRLMDERADLRGVHALADFVDDSVRWTA